MTMPSHDWNRKGATLSDKSARKEFGITQAEIEKAIRAGKLQYRPTSLWGNPFIRLIRCEVEALVAQKHGSGYLDDQKVKTELRAVSREINSIMRRLRVLEQEKAELEAAQGKRAKARH